MSRFRCPKCGSWDNHVYKTVSDRIPHDGKWYTAVRRKRKCQQCSHRWSTIEMNETAGKAWVPSVGENPVELGRKRIRRR